MIKYCTKYNITVLTEADCYYCQFESGEKDGHYWCEFYGKEPAKKEIEHEINIKITKKRYPPLKIRILYKLFPKFQRMGWRWYHQIFPHRILKFFNLEYVPFKWTITTYTYENEFNEEG